MPLRLIGGTAALTVDIHLEPESAGGLVRLSTEGLQARLDEQRLAAELAIGINLVGGIPADMAFDISGSSLRLDQVQVEGATTTVDRADWTAQLDFDEARVVWKKPIELEAKAAVTMSDSRPIVAVMANQRGKYGWIEKLLSVEDIRGRAELSAHSRQAKILYALVGSDKIDVGAKGMFDDVSREGIFYARFRKLDGILKLRNGERRFDIFGAREKFDRYEPGAADVFGEDE